MATKGRKPLNLADMRKSNFVGDWTLDQLSRAYSETFGVSPEMGMTEDEIRAELQADNKLVEISATAPKLEVVSDSAPEGTINVRKIPQLGPHGKWEGRMRRATVVNTQENPMPGVAISLGWEGVTWVIEYDKSYDMPWPFWNALNSAVIRDEHSVNVRSWVPKGEDGQGEMRITRPERVERKRYKILDEGDVPGTENKPECYKQYFEAEARRTNVFEKATQAVLLRIYSILYSGPPVDPRNQYRPVQLNPDQLRFAIAEALHPELVDLVSNQQYEKTA